MHFLFSERPQREKEEEGRRKYFFRARVCKMIHKIEI